MVMMISDVAGVVLCHRNEVIANHQISCCVVQAQSQSDHNADESLMSTDLMWIITENRENATSC